MLIKSALASDYSGVRTIPSTQQPVAGIEFIQKVTLIDYQSTPSGGGTGPVTANPTSLIVDAPSWANFFRYRTIQFSFGAFAPQNGDTLFLNLRKNTQTLNSTARYTLLEAVVGASAVTYTQGSSSGTSANQICTVATAAASTSSFIQRVDVFVSPTGVIAETRTGNMGTSIAGGFQRFSASLASTGAGGSAYNIPAYLEGDNPGVILVHNSLSRFVAPHGGAANALVNYKLDCSIYGWLR